MVASLPQVSAMGYTTEFEGHFDITPPLSQQQADYINLFSSTRRMKRDASRAQNLPDPVREAVGLPVGQEGEFFVGADGFRGQDNDDSVQSYNNPPSTQPGLWCQWVVSEHNDRLEWDGGEKFYEYIEWLEYVNDRFFKPWGAVLNGEINWFGEDPSDRGVLVFVDGVLHTLAGDQEEIDLFIREKKAESEKKELTSAVQNHLDEKEHSMEDEHIKPRHKI